MEMKKKKSSETKKTEVAQNQLKNLPNYLDQRLLVVPIATYS